MSYIPTNWIDGETPVNAENLNKLEQAVQANNTAISEINTARAAGEFKGDKGDKGDRGDPGDNYILTAADKTEIAEQVENATIVQAPKYVNTVEEMTDVNRPYVLISTGRIWANAETTVSGTKTEACDEGYTYPVNSRLSGGQPSASDSYAGYTVTPFIDLLAYPVPFTLHLDGAAFVSPTFDNYKRIATYTAEQSLISEEKHTSVEYDNLLNVSDSDVVVDSDGNSAITFNNTPALDTGAELRYIRLSGKVFGTPRVYVTYEAETTGVQWFDTGTTYAPTLSADERQHIVDEIVNQIDTELLSVIGSGEVV